MLTVVVRTLLFPLTVGQVKSARRVQELRPDMQKIREEHKDDPRKQQEEMMKLYAERRINPLGGCLPFLVQLPIFVTLYYTIKEFESLESFRTGGLLWFGDLTVHDPFFVLPVLYVLTMMASQEFALRNAAPEQRRLMRLLPIVFGAFLAKFPAGLLVYWVANNVVSFLQNLLIYGRPSRPSSETGSDARWKLSASSEGSCSEQHPDEHHRHGERDGARRQGREGSG